MIKKILIIIFFLIPTFTFAGILDTQDIDQYTRTNISGNLGIVGNLAGDASYIENYFTIVTNETIFNRIYFYGRSCNGQGYLKFEYFLNDILQSSSIMDNDDMLQTCPAGTTAGWLAFDMPTYTFQNVGDTFRFRLTPMGDISPNFRFGVSTHSVGSPMNRYWKTGGGAQQASSNEFAYVLAYRSPVGVINPLVDIISPVNASTVGTSTPVSIDIDYDNTGGEYDTLVYKIIYNGFLNNLVEFLNIPIAQTAGNYTATTTFDTEGVYTFEAYLYDSVDDNIFYPIAENVFTVAYNPLPAIIGFDPFTDYEGISGLATTTCGITNLSGCFQNALIFAFYPSGDALNNFGNLIDTLEKKPPFAYIGLLTDTIGGLTDTATPVFALENEGNITTGIFDPLRTGMTWLLWFVFGMWLYKRVTKINL